MIDVMPVATAGEEAPNTADRRLVGSAPASPAGPAEPGDLARLPLPPLIPLSRRLQVLRFNQRQIEFVFRARRELGEVFRMSGVVAGHPVITGHPDHVRSLFTAKVPLVPSLTAESPLRPIVGGNSVLTAQGERHMRQRKLLLPSFHGEAITLDVIMAGIFGIAGKPKFGTAEYGVRLATKRLLAASTWPLAQFAELLNLGREEPVGPTKAGLSFLDRPTYAVIAQRRRAGDLEARDDILSLLLRARTEEGEALTDRELRDELLSLVLAGHETTANQLAWAWERLVRAPAAHERLVEAVRSDSEDAAAAIEATITESMRSRPVIPMVGAPRDGAVAAGRVRRARRHPGGDQHPAPAPPRGRLPRAVCLPPRALGRTHAGHLRVDPVRRRDAPLPGRGAGDGRATVGARGDGAAPGPRGGRPPARACAAPQREHNPRARRPGARALLPQLSASVQSRTSQRATTPLSTNGSVRAKSSAASRLVKIAIEPWFCGSPKAPIITSVPSSL
jgi:cytochrome P450